jgi:hypothetical protein
LAIADLGEVFDTKVHPNALGISLISHLRITSTMTET